MTALIDMTGKRYNRLTAIERVPSPDHVKPGQDAYWRFLCDCGNETITMGYNVRKGATKSCGCLHIESISGDRNRHWNGGYNTFGSRSWCKKKIKSVQASSDRDGYKGPSFTWEDLQKHCVGHDGLCEICGLESDRDVCVDHDHDTGALKGILCHRCNIAIAAFRDSSSIMWNAVRYVEQVKCQA